MGAVWYRARSELRHTWRTSVVLTLLVAVVGGLVLASLAGASRSRTALDRLLERSNPADLFVFGEPEQLDRLATVDEVGELGRLSMYAIVPTAVDPDEVFLPMMASEDGRIPRDVNRIRIIEGRAPDPGAPHEIAVREQTLGLLGVGVGDELEMASLTPAEAQAINEGADDIEFTGPAVTLQVVGVIRDAVDVVARSTDMPIHYLTPAFAERYEGEIGTFVTAALITRAEGTGLDELTRAIAEVGPQLQPEAMPNTTGGFAATFDVIANGLQVFAGVLAVAGLVVLSQALGRSAAARSRDDALLAAVGLGPRQRLLAGAMPGLGVAGLGGVGALLVAVLLSPLFPIGLARRAEPDPGLHVDAVVLVAGALLIALGVAAAALLAARIAAWTARREPLPRRGGRLAALRGVLPPAAVAGIDLASARAAGGVPVRSTRSAVAGGAVGVAAAVVFAASLGHLVDTPRLYGWAFDAGLAGTENNPDELAEGVDLESDPAVAETAPVIFQIDLRVNGHPFFGHAIGFGGPNGIGPVVASGRAPVAADEVALGRETLRRLDVDLGDSVRIDVGSGELPFRVVGQAVIPVNADGQSTVGNGVTMTVSAADRLGLDHTEGACDLNATCYQQTAVRWASGIDVDRATRRLLAAGELSEFGRPRPPAEVERLTDVEQVPWILAGLLAALAAFATAHTIAVTTRRRRRDLGILRTLGFSARQLRTSVSVQALVLVVLASVVGTAVGIGGGRAIWSLVADRVGVRDEALVPWAVLGLPVGVLVLAQVIALLPARTVSRISPAVALRAE